MTGKLKGTIDLMQVKILFPDSVEDILNIRYHKLSVVLMAPFSSSDSQVALEKGAARAPKACA